MTTCPRCHLPTFATSCSWFTSEDVCTDCRDEEATAPNYQRARDAESAAVLQGNYRFPGIGLAREDVAALDAARARRRVSR